MLAEFYIFKKQAGAGARWLEVVSDLEAAKLRLKELAKSVPGYYFIFSIEVGHRLDLNDLEQDEVCSGTGKPT
jgi:hypothetical protein